MENQIYINILKDVLSKKISVLDNLLQITMQQEACIALTPFDMNQFEELMAKKDLLIKQLNQLDSGFESTYEHIKEDLNRDKTVYKDKILQLQQLIGQITEKSIQLQASEKKNKNKLELYLANRKKEIKSFKISSKTASSYYKNMRNQYQEQSYFLDKKK